MTDSRICESRKEFIMPKALLVFSIRAGAGISAREGKYTGTKGFMSLFLPSQAWTWEGGKKIYIVHCTMNLTSDAVINNSQFFHLVELENISAVKYNGIL